MNVMTAEHLSIVSYPVFLLYLLQCNKRKGSNSKGILMIVVVTAVVAVVVAPVVFAAAVVVPID